MKAKTVEQRYRLAKEQYAELGVNTDAALKALAKIPISMHCWQGDDVVGFEPGAGGASGGILSTGNYPGRARNIRELRADLDKAFSLIPGAKRLNLHAIYLDSGKAVARNKITPAHFQSWIDWAKEQKAGLDFNPTYFAHPKASANLTLSSPDAGIREYWIEHGIACRKIAAEMGKQLKSPCIMNTWIPDGFKDITVDRAGARARLEESLDKIFAEKIPAKYMRDAVESKLFGIGVESYTVGSNDFYMMYAARRGKMICLDSGHFHPTESIADKLSAVISQQGSILLHVSRGVRWDSDHVIVLNDELLSIAREAVAYGYLDKIRFCLDYFDASINRIAAWVIGARNLQKALLIALLEPTDLLRKEENSFDFSGRLARLEQIKTLPWNSVWNYYCESQNLPDDYEFMKQIRRYETDVLLKR